MQPTVSVVIPAYNAMAFLPETLASVLNQTFTDFEVIIVNDGSKDNIVEWFSRISDSRVRLISQENKGLAGARNAGIIESQGHYIAFIDADDLWEPNKLKKQVEAFKANPELGLVDTYVSMVDVQNQFLHVAGATYQEGNVLRRAIEENLVMCGSSVMVTRQCFETVGFFDQTLRAAEDWNMWARIALHYPFKVVEEPLVRYRNHSTSMSKDWRLMKTETTKAIEKVFELVPPELAWVKQRTFARANLYVAKIAKSGGNYQQSLQYCLQAFACSPPVCLNADYLRLIVKNFLRIA